MFLEDLGLEAVDFLLRLVAFLHHSLEAGFLAFGLCFQLGDDSGLLFVEVGQPFELLHGFRGSCENPEIPRTNTFKSEK